MVVDAKERITTQVAVVTKRASVPPQRDSTKALCLNHFIVWHTQILKLQNCYEITGRFASTRFTGFRSQLNTSRGRQSLSILEEQSASKIFASHINSKWKKRKYGDIYIYIYVHTHTLQKWPQNIGLTRHTSQEIPTKLKRRVGWDAWENNSNLHCTDRVVKMTVRFCRVGSVSNEPPLQHQ